MSRTLEHLLRIVKEDRRLVSGLVDSSAVVSELAAREGEEGSDFAHHGVVCHLVYIAV